MLSAIVRHCRLSRCGRLCHAVFVTMPAQADAVDMTMLHAIWRQCRLSRCGRLRHAVSVTMPAQPMRPSVPCGLRDRAVRFGRQCFTSFTREMPGNADAVRFGRQRFTSFMREMPINRRCRPSRCGLCGHAVFVTMLFVMSALHN